VIPTIVFTVLHILSVIAAAGVLVLLAGHYLAPLLRRGGETRSVHDE